MAHPTSSAQSYINVFIALLVLTALTVGVAFIDLGPFNNFMALAIAGTKAILVVLIFMHVRESSALTWVVVGGGCFWLVLLIALTMSDYLTRGWQTVIGW